MASLYTSEVPDGGGTNNADGGASGITVANLMYATVAGTVTQIRYYATTTTSGTWTGELWVPTNSDDAGPALGTRSAVQVGATPTGGTWNLITLPAGGVHFAANAPFRPAINNSQGRYVSKAGGHGSIITNGVLNAVAAGADPFGLGVMRNGTFAINSAPNTYPGTASGGNTDYLVDVTFIPDGASFDPRKAAAIMAWV